MSGEVVTNKYTDDKRSLFVWTLSMAIRVMLGISSR